MNGATEPRIGGPSVNAAHLFVGPKTQYSLGTRQIFPVIQW
jgi:hypothetical protein